MAQSLCHSRRRRACLIPRGVPLDSLSLALDLEITINIKGRPISLLTLVDTAKNRMLKVEHWTTNIAFCNAHDIEFLYKEDV
jgi:hypothetical protein